MGTWALSFGFGWRYWHIVSQPGWPVQNGASHHGSGKDHSTIRFWTNDRVATAWECATFFGNAANGKKTPTILDIVFHNNTIDGFGMGLHRASNNPL
jgi:hypothetical protein